MRIFSAGCIHFLFCFDIYIYIYINICICIYYCYYVGKERRSADERENDDGMETITGAGLQRAQTKMAVELCHIFKVNFFKNPPYSSPRRFEYTKLTTERCLRFIVGSGGPFLLS